MSPFYFYCNLGYYLMTFAFIAVLAALACRATLRTMQRDTDWHALCLACNDGHFGQLEHSEGRELTDCLSP